MGACLEQILAENLSPSETSPEALAKLAANGDRQAFADLIDLQYDFIFRVAYKWLGDQGDAEDITQTVVIKLAKAVRQFDGRSKFSSWLYRVTLNVVRDHQRQSMRRGRNVEALSLVGVSHTPSTQEDQTAANEIWTAVRQLPEKQRDAMLMIYAEEMSHAECAAIMGCKEKTVSWYVHEAKKTLKGLL